MTKRAVVVGVNDYSVQGFNSLSMCVRDASSFYHMLIDAFEFDPADIFYLTDGQATSSRIRAALRYILTQAQAGDVACFYYSGHGGSTPHPANPKQLFQTIIPFSGQFISDHEIFQLADTLQPSVCNFTLVLDSCHSGGMHDESDTARRRSPAFSPDLMQRLAQCDTLLPVGICLPPPARGALSGNIQSATPRDAGVVIVEDSGHRLLDQSKSTLIAACAASELSWEVQALGHGVLTQAILDLVVRSRFEIDHSTLIGELSTRVAALAAQHLPGVTQTPQLRGQANRMGEDFLLGWRDCR